MVQKTLALIKPDAVHRADEIVDSAFRAGYTVLQRRRVQMTPEEASEFYDSESTKVHFTSLVTFMSRYANAWRVVFHRITEGESVLAFWPPPPRRRHHRSPCRSGADSVDVGPCATCRMCAHVVLEPASLNIGVGGASRPPLLLAPSAADKPRCCCCCSGPVEAMVITNGDNTIFDWDAFVGPEDPVEAFANNPDSIRALFGDTDPDSAHAQYNLRNAVHGSKSVVAASREIRFFFPDDIVEPLPSTESAREYVSEVSSRLASLYTPVCSAIHPTHPSSPSIAAVDICYIRGHVSRSPHHLWSPAEDQPNPAEGTDSARQGKAKGPLAILGVLARRQQPERPYHLGARVV